MSDGARTAFAIVVTVVFLAFGTFLVLNADTTNDRQWEHWVYVFGAAEAIAFAAVGWVFGKEVNRQRAENAESDARDAREQAAQERAKGAQLAGMVKGAVGGEAGRARLEAQGVNAGNNLAEVLAFAESQYP